MKRLYMMDSCYYEHAVFSSHVVLNSDSTMDQRWCVGCVVCLFTGAQSELSCLYSSLTLIATWNRKCYQTQVVCELLKGDLLFLGHYQKRMDGF